jgi:hypothetical protein
MIDTSVCARTVCFCEAFKDLNMQSYATDKSCPKSSKASPLPTSQRQWGKYRSRRISASAVSESQPFDLSSILLTINDAT